VQPLALSAAAKSASLPDTIQRLRLDELRLLNDALEQTRDRITSAPSRAKAAALLKGKAKCNTNEFDRWVKSLSDQLTPENRLNAASLFPELASMLQPQPGKKE